MGLACSLQINLAPNDYPHARYILPHQLAVLKEQVSEVVLVLDSHKSKGRFGGHWEENLEKMNQLLAQCCRADHRVRSVVVNYAKSTMSEVADFFFGTSFIPKKDYRGGPFYAYFFGLHQCRSDYIFHLDADMMLGGHSATWINEAMELLSGDQSLFTCAPLPGPPHPQHILIGQPSATAKELNNYSFLFHEMSTRIFMIRRNSFLDKKLRLIPPAGINRAKALIRKNPPYELPEVLMSRHMSSSGLSRVDFLGNGAGLWSLHPPYRNARFYKMLPQLISDITNRRLPEAQNGFYDIVDEVCDWSDARQALKNKRWWKKLIYERIDR